MKAQLHIQCTAPDGSGPGTFLAIREPGQPIENATLASPVCKDLVELSAWMTQNLWVAAPHDPQWPTGVYRKA